MLKIDKFSKSVTLPGAWSSDSFGVLGAVEGADFGADLGAVLGADFGADFGADLGAFVGLSGFSFPVLGGVIVTIK